MIGDGRADAGADDGGVGGLRLSVVGASAAAALRSVEAARAIADDDAAVAEWAASLVSPAEGGEAVVCALDEVSPHCRALKRSVGARSNKLPRAGSGAFCERQTERRMDALSLPRSPPPVFGSSSSVSVSVVLRL